MFLYSNISHRLKRNALARNGWGIFFIYIDIIRLDKTKRVTCEVVRLWHNTGVKQLHHREKSNVISHAYMQR